MARAVLMIVGSLAREFRPVVVDRRRSNPVTVKYYVSDIVEELGSR
jgi:hypothetical protein